jgi:hypothetical protein
MHFAKICKTCLVATVSLSSVAATASAAIVYQDSFNRTGNLVNTAPDVVNTGGNLWQNPQGFSYTTSPSSANNTGFFGSIYLPVNGGSGVILDGTSNFSLSVTVNGSAGPHMGIALNTTVYAGGDMWAGNNDPQGKILAALGVNTSGQTTSTYDNGTLYAINGNAFGLSTTTTLTMSYNAATDVLTYTAGATTIATQVVSQAQIAALTYVSIDNGSYANNAGTFTNFTLDVAAVPEPASVGLLIGGFGALAFARRRRSAGI